MAAPLFVDNQAWYIGTADGVWEYSKSSEVTQHDIQIETKSCVHNGMEWYTIDGRKVTRPQTKSGIIIVRNRLVAPGRAKRLFINRRN